MKFSIQSCALFLGFVLAVQGKIVFLNGTEVDYLKTANVTTSAPVQKWFSVFNPRNISNHSGTKTKIETLTLNRKHDAEETTTENYDNISNGTMATRSGRQLRLFYMQRFLNGLHLLALLGGIYLMIFVVEPVAVPHHYLAQHYYGLPWSADRRNGLRPEHRDRIANLPFMRRNSPVYDSIQGHNRTQWTPDHVLKNLGINFQPHGKTQNQPKEIKLSPIYRSKSNFSTSNGSSRVRYISAQQLGQKRNSTNIGKVHHWSKWVPTQNATDKPPHDSRDRMQWSPSRLHQRRNAEDYNAKGRVLSSSGSATSMQLSEIFTNVAPTAP